MVELKDCMNAVLGVSLAGGLLITLYIVYQGKEDIYRGIDELEKFISKYL